MLVIFGLSLVFMISFLSGSFCIFGLRTEADDFFFCGISEYIEQIYDGHVTVRSFGERILHPTV